MTEVIGQAWIEVLGKTAEFGPDLKRKLSSSEANRAAEQAGDKVGTAIGRGIGKTLHPLAGRAADDYGREFSRKAKDHGLSFGKLVGAGITAGLGINSIQSIFGKAMGTIADASDLAESQSKNVAVFHASADAVEDFAADSTRNLLLTKQAAIEASATFGNLFVSLGIADKPAADLSTRLVQLSEDLSSFNNVGTDEALDALRSGLLGEPLRKFGVTLSEGRIQAEAFALGIAKPVKDADAIQAAHVKIAQATANLAKVQKEHGTGTVAAATAQVQLTKANDALNKALDGQKTPLTAAQKAQAAYSIILKDTATAQGDALRTSDGYANQTRILHKNLGDLSAQIGEAVLPKALALTTTTSDLVVEFQNGTGAGGAIRDTLGDIGDVARDVGEILRDTVVPVFKFVADHPDVFKHAAEGMAAYAIASKAASTWNALLAVSVPAVAAGSAATAAAAPAAAGGIAAMGGAATLALPQIAAIGAALFAAYQTGKVLKGLLDDLKPEEVGDPTYGTLSGPGRKLWLPDPDNPGKVQLFDPAAPGGATQHPNTDEHGAPTVNRNIQASKDVAKAALDAKKAVDTTGTSAKFAADQLAAYQERQRLALEASQDAIRERSERTQRSLEAQGDAIKRQISVLEAGADKIRDFRAEVFGGTQQFTALSSLVQDPSRATAAGLVGSLQARNKATALFGKNLTVLQGRGLDKGVLAEIAREGPDRGRAFASALATATPSEISALNAAEKQARAQAQQLAAITTAQQFGPQALDRLTRGIATQNRLLAGIEGRLAQLPKQLQQALKDDKVRITAKQKARVTT